MRSDLAGTAHERRHVAPARLKSVRPGGRGAWGLHMARVDPWAVAPGVEGPRGAGAARGTHVTRRATPGVGVGGRTAPGQRGRGSAGAGGARRGGRGEGRAVPGAFGQGRAGRSAGHPRRETGRNRAAGRGRRRALRRAPTLPAPRAVPSLRPASCPAPSLGGCGAALPAHSEPGGDREAEAGRPWVRVRELSRAGGPSLPAAPGGGPGGCQPAPARALARDPLAARGDGSRGRANSAAGTP